MPSSGVPKARLGVALLVPAPLAAEVDGLRRGLGDGALGRIPPHLTLVPPVNVRLDRLGDALAVLRSAAAATRPFRLALGPVATFLPVNPVAYLAVGAADGFESLRALRDAVFTDPLSRPLTWPWVPHVTLADEAGPGRIAAALDALADYRVEATFDRVHLLREGPGRVWETIADAAFAPPAVVGRGGLPVELSVSDHLDPVAAGLGRAGRPFAVTARRDGAVVGTTTGATGAGPEAVLSSILVDPTCRGEGIGTHLLASTASLVADRGSSSITAAGPLAAVPTVVGFLRHLGWAHDAGRLWRRLG